MEFLKNTQNAKKPKKNLKLRAPLQVTYLENTRECVKRTNKKYF